jgi:hypothetical protein|tara:strand:+ start:757 stop:1248 length:492 start_codon:yes stop_codon:yes gene_type:complete
MDYGRSYKVAVVIASADSNLARRSLQGLGGPIEREQVRVASQVQAVLRSSTPEVIVAPSEEQRSRVGTDRNTRFEWTVTPNTFEAFTLTISLTNLVRVEGETVPDPREPLIKNVAVNTSNMQRISAWIDSLNPFFVLIGALGVMVPGALWLSTKRLKSRNVVH